jgi:hypothetical protein
VRRAGGLFAALLAASALVASTVHAQTPGSSRGPTGAAPAAPRAEFGVSGLLGAPVSFGTVTADLQRPDGSPLTLFETDNRQGPEFGVRLHLNARVSRRLAVEVAGGVSRARLETTIRDDFEGESGAVLREPFFRLGVDGGLVWTVAGDERLSWFVRGTGGWMRELIGGRVLGENGAVAQVGAGMKYWGPRRPSGRVRYGFRLEGHVATRWNGTALDAKQIHLAPVVTAGLIIGS